MKEILGVMRESTSIFSRTLYAQNTDRSEYISMIATLYEDSKDQNGVIFQLAVTASQLKYSLRT